MSFLELLKTVPRTDQSVAPRPRRGRGGDRAARGRSASWSSRSRPATTVTQHRALGAPDLQQAGPLHRLSRRRLRRHRGAPGRRPDRPHGPPRRADRPAQPAPAARESRRRARQRAAAAASECAMLLVDLDRFKTINDSPRPCRRRPSAPAGRALLRDGDLRRDDRRPPRRRRVRDRRARRSRAASELEQLCLALVGALQGPFLYREQRLFVGASIGVAIGPRDGDTVEEMIRNADLALYRAKDGSGNDIRFFEPALPRPRRGAPPDRAGAARRGRRGRVHPQLPAGGRRRDARDQELRGAAALAQSRARPDLRRPSSSRSPRRPACSAGSANGCCAPPAARRRPGPRTSRSRSTCRRASCAIPASSSPWSRR